GLIDLFVDDPAAPAWRSHALGVHGLAVEAAPAPPEDHRQDETDHTHDHEDDAHGVDVEPGCTDGDGKIEDRSDGNQEDARSETHPTLLGKPWYGRLRSSYVPATSGVNLCPSPVTLTGGGGRPPDR